MYDFEEIRNTDPQIADAIKAEMERQNSHIELIASGELGEQSGDGGDGKSPHQQIRGRIPG